MGQKSKDKRTVKPGSMMGAGIAIGMGAGVAIGAAMDNIGAGLAIGAGIGVALGVALSQRGRKESKDDGS
ncbi:MAG: hypothetical protein B6I35_15285 [Anaerolineaceae bacterium 4572_32.2]|nr:MAG: hypothetical protein B6I35_15285 [Anaerolineaceae bacterium 4572_32.2]HEY73215.1 hypothetical protein [Thermoflexia bacterium]